MTSILLDADRFPNVECIDKLEPALRPVYQTEVFIEDPESKTVRLPHKAVYTLRDGVPEALGIYHPGYELLTHGEALHRLFEALDDYGAKSRVKDVQISRNAAKMMALIEFPEFVTDLGGGDLYSTEILVQNSYDGSSAFSFSLVSTRFLCLNGMFLGFVRGHFASRHVLKMRETLSDTLQVLVDLLGDGPNHLRSFVNGYADIPLETDWEKELAAIAEEASIPKKYITRAREAYRPIGVGESAETADGHSLWSLYNAFTNALTHGGASLAVRMNRTQRVLNVIDERAGIRRKTVTFAPEVPEIEEGGEGDSSDE